MNAPQTIARTCFDAVRSAGRSVGRAVRHRALPATVLTCALGAGSVVAGAAPALAYDGDKLGRTSAFYESFYQLGKVGVPVYKGVFSQSVYRTQGTSHVYKIQWENTRPGGIGTIRADFVAYDSLGRAYWTSEGAPVGGNRASYTGNRAVSLDLQPDSHLCGTLRKVVPGQEGWVEVVTACKYIG